MGGRGEGGGSYLLGCVNHSDTVAELHGAQDGCEHGQGQRARYLPQELIIVTRTNTHKRHLSHREGGEASLSRHLQPRSRTKFLKKSTSVALDIVSTEEECNF